MLAYIYLHVLACIKDSIRFAVTRPKVSGEISAGVNSLRNNMHATASPCAESYFACVRVSKFSLSGFFCFCFVFLLFCLFVVFFVFLQSPIARLRQ